LFRVQIVATLLLVVLVSSARAGVSCESLFEKSNFTKSQTDNIIVELYSLRRKALSSDPSSKIARILFKEKYHELTQYLSVDEVNSRLKIIEFVESKTEPTFQSPPELTKILHEDEKLYAFLDKINLSIDGVDEYGETPIYHAISIQDVDVINALIRHNVDVNAKGSEDYYPLQFAAYHGKTEAVRILIGHKADLDATSKPFPTALTIASEEGYTDIVKLLIQAGADVNKIAYGQSPLMDAVKSNKKDVVQTLIKAGADVNLNPYGSYGNSALWYASQFTDAEMIKILKKAGAK
jgi:ankyrin repeat protein